MDLASFIELWNKILDDEDFLFKLNFYNIIDYLGNSMRDTNKRGFSDYEIEMILVLAKWISIHKKEKSMLKNIFALLGNYGLELDLLYFQIFNIQNFQIAKDLNDLFNENASFFLNDFHKEINKELSAISLTVEKINNALKGPAFIKAIISYFSLDMSDEEIVVHISYMINNLLNHYSKEYLKNIRQVIIKTFYEENLKAILYDAKNDASILEEALTCIRSVLESLRICQDFDLEIMYRKDVLGLSEIFRYLYHIYKTFLFSTISKNSKYDQLINLYDTESASRFDSIDKIEEESYSVMMDYAIKVVLYSNNISIFEGYRDHFISLDKLLTQKINDRGVSNTNDFFPKFHNIDLGRNAIPSFTATLIEGTNKELKPHLRFLHEHINDDIEFIISPKFTEILHKELQEYLKHILKLLRDNIETFDIDLKKFLSNVLIKFILFISNNNTANNQDILPSILNNEEKAAVLIAIREFLMINEQSYFVYSKSKNLDIANDYIISNNLVIYNKEKIHLGYCYEILDSFRSSNNNNLCILSKVVAKDNNSAILNSIRHIQEFLNISAFRRYERPFDFYGYQTQITNPVFELEFHVFSKKRLGFERGDVFSTGGREMRDRISLNDDDLSVLSIIESSNNLVLRNAINWFKKGIFEIDSPTKLLFHWIGLEQIMSEYGNKEKRYETISRLMIEEFKTIPGLHLTYNSIMTKLNNNEEFQQLICTEKRFKKFKFIQNYSISDIESISKIISDKQTKSQMDNFIYDFKRERVQLIGIYKKSLKKEIFLIHRIATIRNRLVHSGKYDNRYDIFAKRLESLLHKVILELLNFPNIQDFRTFFKKYDTLLEIPLDRF